MNTIRKDAVPGASMADNIIIIVGRTFSNNIVAAALFLIVMIWTIPTAGLLISSFRPEDELLRSGWWSVFTDPNLTIENYDRVIKSEDMGDAFVNSLTVTIPSTILPISIAAFAAYAFSWMEFPGRRLLLSIVIGLIVVPLQMTLIPLLRIYTTLNLNGTFVGIWLAHTGFGLPLAIFLLRNYIASLPRELIESAAIDGASHFEIFTRLVIPLSVPVLASFAIFQFLWVWNDLLIALVFLGDKPIVTRTLADLVGNRGQDWHLLTAGAFVSMILPLVVFFSLQRYFIRGLLAGSVKG